MIPTAHPMATNVQAPSVMGTPSPFVLFLEAVDPEMAMTTQANLQGEVRCRHLILKCRYLPNSLGYTKRGRSEGRRSALGTKGAEICLALTESTVL